MDSLTQIALGSAVAVAASGRRTAVWKAALWGAVCGTLPDLDSFIDFGDPISDMTFHRAESHAIFYQTLAAPFIAWIASRLHGEAQHFRRWWLIVWLALVTHPLLDVMTVYGTQLALPFTNHPFGVGSIFVIDPLYTLPLIVGVIAALRLRNGRGTRWNLAGLALSTAYLGWSVIAQHYVTGIVRDSLRAQHIEAQQVLVTPTAFNTLLWRVLVMSPGAYHEGYYSLLDDERRVELYRFERDESLYARMQGNWHVDRLAWFSHGFFKMEERDGRVTITDLRLGQEPYYGFTFIVADRRGNTLVSRSPEAIPIERDLGVALDWLWRRMWGERLPWLWLSLAPAAAGATGAATSSN